MSESVLERSVLERKERDELQAIARAMGAQPAARTRKADLVDLILTTAGVIPAESATQEADGAVSKPRRRSRGSAASTGNGVEQSTNGSTDEASTGEGPMTNGSTGDGPGPDVADRPVSGTDAEASATSPQADSPVDAGEQSGDPAAAAGAATPTAADP
ncbi:MAG TPA: hypothetical protein VGV93_12880, partial [Acidimicrobiales bacterium]|nr:hypothetical protein [Acidimicrobiales bacterium]